MDWIVLVQELCGGKVVLEKVCQDIFHSYSLRLTCLAVYAYIPTPNNLCSEKSVVCNSDFGVSIQRGNFGFVSGEYVMFLIS